MSTTTTHYTMTGGLDLGPVELTVADLTRSLSYYTQPIGLQLLGQDSRSAHLGVPGRLLAVLREIPGAPHPPRPPAPDSVTPLPEYRTGRTWRGSPSTTPTRASTPT